MSRNTFENLDQIPAERLRIEYRRLSKAASTARGRIQRADGESAEGAKQQLLRINGRLSQITACLAA
jgi:hypothetical protein